VEVDVLIKENDEHLIVDVISHGNTIPKEEQTKLFEAFKRGKILRIFQVPDWV
jgi:signal transduction histidine kinase